MAKEISSKTPALGLLMRDLSRLMRRQFEARTVSLGLTQGQWAVIYGLFQHEGINQARLADMLDIEPITLVGLLDKLCKSGLVERRPDPQDRRAKRLYLTRNAEPLIHKVDSIRSDLRQEAFAGISPQQQEQLFIVLEQVRKNLSGKTRDNIH